MGKKNIHGKKTSAGKTHALKPQAKKQSVQLAEPKNRKKEILLVIISILLTLIVYIPSLKNDFILNWDDGGYIHEHELIHKLTWENVKTIFNPTTFYKGNYHPLTTFFYAVEYSLVGEKAFLYHLNNLLLHLLNVLLVFVFINLLTRLPEVSFITALLFGIHPMHVESVAWISERKDVLYTFFFFLSLIQYFYYLKKNQNRRKHYLLALLFFFLSLLSKSAAVILPVTMLVIDYFLKRKLSLKLFYEKIPFFVLSIIIGVIAVFSQGEKGAIQDLTPMFTFFERLLIVCHSTFTYLWKLFVPVNLAAMYPYPSRINGLLPAMYYVAAAIIIPLVVMLVIFFIQTLMGKRLKYLPYVFGLVFFFVNIALVLQIIPVGGAAMAERYTYVPYIGLFFILGTLFHKGIYPLTNALKKLVPVWYILMAVFVLFLMVLTWQRIGKWKNGEVLMRDLTKVYPYLPFAYNNLGYYYYRWEKNLDKALKEFDIALKMDSTYYQAWSNRGVVYNNLEKHEQAVHDFTKALKYKPDNHDGLIGKANSLSALQRFEEALPFYNRYLQLKPEDAKAVLKRGTAYTQLGRYQEAIKDYETYRKTNPNDYEVYYWLGITYYKMQNYPLALENLNKAIALNSKKSELYSWRGLVNYSLKMVDQAIADYNTAIQMNPNDAAAFVNRSVAYFDKGNYLQAWEDINTAGRMQYPLDRAYFMRLQNIVAGMKKK